MPTKGAAEVAPPERTPKRSAGIALPGSSWRLTSLVSRPATLNSQPSTLVPPAAYFAYEGHALAALDLVACDQAEDSVCVDRADPGRVGGGVARGWLPPPGGARFLNRGAAAADPLEPGQRLLRLQQGRGHGSGRAAAGDAGRTGLRAADAGGDRDHHRPRHRRRALPRLSRRLADLHPRPARGDLRGRLHRRARFRSATTASATSSSSSSSGSSAWRARPMSKPAS